MSESWNDVFGGQFAKDSVHLMGCSSCKYFRNDNCKKHNLCRGRYSQPCTDFISKDDPLTRQVELLRRDIEVLFRHEREHENRIKNLEIYVEKLHQECERLYKQGYSDGRTTQQDIYKALLGLDAPENALTTVQEMNEKAKEVKNITDEWDRVRMTGDKRAIAQYKADHGYTMTKEEMDILEEEGKCQV